MNNLEELKKKYEELEKEIERLEKEKSCKRWRAEEYDDYFCVNSFGNINRIQEQNDNNDNFAYKSRNYFKTREEAEEHLDRLNTYYDLMDLAEELNNGEKIDWDNTEQGKFSIYYELENKKLNYTISHYVKELGSIYCLDEDFLEKAKERIGEVRLKGLFI